MDGQIRRVEPHLEGEVKIFGGELFAIVPVDALTQLDLEAGEIIVERRGQIGGQRSVLLAGGGVDLPQIVGAELVVSTACIAARHVAVEEFWPFERTAQVVEDKRLIPWRVDEGHFALAGCTFFARWRSAAGTGRQ